MGRNYKVEVVEIENTRERVEDNFSSLRAVGRLNYDAADDQPNLDPGFGEATA